jgi:hypothetical protein
VGGYVYSRSDSGLVLAEHGQDEAAVAHALRQHDDQLRLVRQPLGDTLVWKVYRYAGSDRPAEFLLAWTTSTGEPLPLSMRLVDEVQRHDRNSPGVIVDADRQTQQLHEQRQRQDETDDEAIAHDWEGRERLVPAFHRSPALAAARRRGRRKGFAG